MAEPTLEEFEARHREALEAFNDGDFERAFANVPDDFEWHVMAEAPDTQVLTGAGEIAAYFAEVAEALDSFTARPEHYSEFAPGVFVVRVQLTARGRASGIDVERAVHHVAETADGAPVRTRVFNDRQAALRAAQRAAAKRA